MPLFRYSSPATYFNILTCDQDNTIAENVAALIGLNH